MAHPRKDKLSQKHKKEMVDNGGVSNDSKREDGVKVAFSLGKSSSSSKKSRKTNSALLSSFGDDEEAERRRRRSETRDRDTPLVIPLPDSQKGSSFVEQRIKEEKKSADQLAVDALNQSAANRLSEAAANQSNDTTNFSSQGKLVIAAQSSETRFRAEATTDKDAQKFQRDLEALPQDVGVDSEAYDRIPIHEFGAAMLRGMGWTGAAAASSSSSSSAPAAPVMRPQRLGLGATPKLMLPPSNGSSKRPRSQAQVQRDERLAQQQAEFDAQRKKQVVQDKQLTLQTGSIVWWCRKRRAKMIKLTGVPGLNRVLVRFEGEANDAPVRKGDITLVDRSDLESKPFREVSEKKQTTESKGSDPRESDKRKHKERDRPKDDRPTRDRNAERKRKRRDDREEGTNRGRRRSDEDKRKRKEGSRRRGGRSNSEEEDYDDDGRHRSWLIPNIRVRVVTRKLGSRYFKEKGVVVDVTRGPCATLHLSGGQVLDRVPERYLETALPKAGGNAVVLAGRSKHMKGKLLERNADSGKGIVQIYEDMSVLTLSLDDLAEWVGPLDDDLME